MEGTLMQYIVLFSIPFAGTIILTPLITKIALYLKIIDSATQHKTHNEPKPLLGGLGIFVCFSATVILFLPVSDKLLPLVFATVIISLIGILDDIYNLKPLLKLLGQTAAASIFVLWDISLYRVLLDYFARLYLPNVFVLILIIGWIVLMINAFNLIDGLDGLAAGTAAIIFLAMAVLSLLEGGRPSILGIQLAGLGACLGFLVFNFHPAKIFMGDTGSMLLGFVLAAAHLYTIKFPFSAQLVLGTMFIFAYPALDIAYAIFRRLLKGVSILQADQGHIHHVLLSLGFSVRKTVLTIYLINIIFASLAVLLLSINIATPYLFMIYIITAILIILLFNKLFSISRQNGLTN